MRLQHKVSLITGAAQGIGLATALKFAQEGAIVIVCDVKQAAVDDAVKQCQASGAQAIGFVVDVTQREMVDATVKAVLEKFGRIDVLFSNAGNFGTVAPIEQYPTATFDAVLAVHVRGAFLAAKYAVPHMGKGGSIIITSSVAGLRGDPGVYGYITAKHAQTGLMRVLAKDLAPRGIRVNTINPGPVANAFQAKVEDDLTPLLGRDATVFFDENIPMGRHATPQEIAASVLYLASDQSAYTTGLILSVDGGMSV